MVTSKLPNVPIPIRTRMFYEVCSSSRKERKRKMYVHESEDNSEA